MKAGDLFRKLAADAHKQASVQREADAIVERELARLRGCACAGKESSHVGFEVTASPALRQAVAEKLRAENLIVVPSGEHADTFHVTWGAAAAVAYEPDEEPASVA